MNIQKAKTQVKYAIRSYLTKDERGKYVIPIERQRPVFLMGPPGIGKTAIIGQIAQELKIASVSYSMTHHTRQSAVGLPYIKEETFNGTSQRVTEYTMSEILASVYETIERTGVQEGILFLDEINCVSETLAPSILQFLQYKMFGRHRLPEGWILVTAGNPPEYNKSVREFDIATWDRLKRINVEADLDTWMGYAAATQVHPAITAYLKIRRNDFFIVKNTIEGTEFVTARSWADLSDILKLYEKQGFPVDDDLLSQYIQCEEASRNFNSYYALYRKYQDEYPVEDILNGSTDPKVLKRTSDARLDERISVLSLLLSPINQECQDVSCQDGVMRLLLNVIKEAKNEETLSWTEKLDQAVSHITSVTSKEENASALSPEEKEINRMAVQTLRKMQQQIIESPEYPPYDIIKKNFAEENNRLQKMISDARMKISSLFRFYEKVDRPDNEILLLVTELTANHYTASFLSRYGCDEYFQHSDRLKFQDQESRIAREIENLDLQ